jgi:hypothetical protein
MAISQATRTTHQDRVLDEAAAETLRAQLRGQLIVPGTRTTTPRAACTTA